MTPGTFILVAGPSGAGKDTLIAAARNALGADDRFVFVRRIVTRGPNAFEDHDTMPAEDFAARAAAGAFALHWHAHGLHYGLPGTVSAHLAAGHHVIANVSRAAVPEARRKFSRVAVIYVDADPELRAARIASRGRDAPQGSRLAAYSFDVTPAECDAVIDNSGAVAEAATSFVAAIRRFTR